MPNRSLVPCICIFFYISFLLLPLANHEIPEGFKPCMISTWLNSTLHLTVYCTAGSRLAKLAEGAGIGSRGGSGGRSGFELEAD